MSQKAVKEGFIQALEACRKELIDKGGRSCVAGIIKNVLDADDFPRGKEEMYILQEDKLCQAIFTAHGLAVDRIFRLFIKMTKDGAIKVDAKRVDELSELARQERDDDSESVED